MSMRTLKASITISRVPGSMEWTDAQLSGATVNSSSALGSSSMCAEQTTPYFTVLWPTYRNPTSENFSSWIHIWSQRSESACCAMINASRSESGRGLPRAHDPHTANARNSSRLLTSASMRAINLSASATFILRKCHSRLSQQSSGCWVDGSSWHRADALRCCSETVCYLGSYRQAPVGAILFVTMQNGAPAISRLRR